MQVVDELGENRLNVADQRHVDRVISADSIGVDVALNQRSRGYETRMPIEGRGFVERRAEREQHVDLVAEQGFTGLRVARDAEHAEACFVILRKHALRAWAGRDAR